jgi:hypothetical protein
MPCRRHGFLIPDAVALGSLIDEVTNAVLLHAMLNAMPFDPIEEASSEFEPLL